MRGRTLRLACATGALMSVMSATNAWAIGTTYGATFSGNASGVDTLGIFGAKGASLNGASYSETFLINTLIGVKRSSSNQQDEWSTNSGFIAATLTINGKTVSVNSADYGEAFVNNGGLVTNSSTGIAYAAGYGGSNAYHTVYDYAAGSSSVSGYLGVLAGYANNNTASFAGFPTGLDQPFTVPVGTNGTSGAGYLNLYTDGCLTDVESIALRETVAAAPEPEQWLLLVAGVAAPGLMLRRGGREAVPRLVD